jgi:hypothetical protein
MTAIENATLKVSVPEITQPYFSQFPDIVSRSLWDPLAPGVLGGAKDLVGRVVMLAAVFLLGYLFWALVSRCFWRNIPPRSNELQELKQLIQKLEQKIPLDRSLSKQDYRSQKNPDDIYNVPHTHNQSTDFDLSPFKEKILHLCDKEKLQEKDCIYTEDLSTEVLIEEKKQIKLLMEDSKTQLLVDFINRNVNSAVSRSALGALFVLLGIKPALVKDAQELNKELLSILIKLVNEKGNLSLKAFSNFDGVYFANEKPFPFFNPRNFLNLSSELSFAEAVAICYPHPGDETCQCLSYLLGYGPSWETFMSNIGYANEKSISCIFNKNHYYEIGKVLNQSLFNKVEVRSEIEKLGFSFHSQFASLVEQGRCGKEERSARRDIAAEKIKEMLKITGAVQIFDGLTARTDYFKKSYTLKKWVMETYFSSLI